MVASWVPFTATRTPENGRGVVVPTVTCPFTVRICWALSAQGVASSRLEIEWAPVEDLAAYIVYIEQDELDVSLTARLPGSVTTFVVPDGFLLPGTTYQLGIGTVTAEGNTSFVETDMTTAGREAQR